MRKGLGLQTIDWSPTAGQFRWTYTLAGQYQTVTFPNGQVRSYAYDDQGRLLTLSNTLASTTLATYGYGYDVDNQTGQSTMLGQRTSMTATVPAQGLNGALSKYYYDPLYQLTRADYPAGGPFNGEIHQWTYDAIGNRLTNTVNGVPAAYTYFKNGSNPLNGQRLSSDGVSAYTWDANGSNLTRNGTPGNFTFGYDPDNRLTSITGAATASYTYDYQGRRTSKTVGGVTTTYLYDGLNLVGETTGGVTANYVFGSGIDEPLAQYRAGTLSYSAADALGTIGEMNDTAGNPMLSTSFDVWGVTRNETGTRNHPFTYTGREVGEAGLLFYRARFLQPGVGRFTQEDPIQYARLRSTANVSIPWPALGSRPSEIQLSVPPKFRAIAEAAAETYRYTRDPIIYRDPLGLLFFGEKLEPPPPGGPSNCIDCPCWTAFKGAGGPGALGLCSRCIALALEYIIDADACARCGAGGVAFAECVAKTGGCRVGWTSPSCPGCHPL